MSHRRDELIAAGDGPTHSWTNQSHGIDLLTSGTDAAGDGGGVGGGSGGEPLLKLVVERQIDPSGVLPRHINLAFFPSQVTERPSDRLVF